MKIYDKFYPIKRLRQYKMKDINFKLSNLLIESLEKNLIYI